MSGLRRLFVGWLAFLTIAALVFGGLGWVMLAALALEKAQAKSAAQAEHSEKLRLAMWRLDSRLTPGLVREDSRPYQHYSAMHVPYPALMQGFTACEPGNVLVPSPLLDNEVPGWMLLHFQVDASGWKSPQVISHELARVLRAPPFRLLLVNVTADRIRLLHELNELHAPVEVIARLGAVPDHAPEDPDSQKKADEIAQTQAPGPGNTYPTNNESWGQYGQQAGNSPRGGRRNEPEYFFRSELWNRLVQENKSAYQNISRDVVLNAAPPGKDPRDVPNPLTPVELGTMTPLWLTAEGLSDRLLVARLAKVGGKPIAQGIVVDWPGLQAMLAAEVADLFPAAKVSPVEPGDQPAPERTMSALPLRLDPGPAPEPDLPRWTTLRLGLALACVAAAVALLAVGLGGWSLVSLSERRIRFVSAVTHELRTPLTTLRLYLDLLSSGMVRDEKQRDEYLTTLNAESDRLHRLIGNVLDFARLERQRPRLEMTPTSPASLLGQVKATWEARCGAAGKELVVECEIPPGVRYCTDGRLLEQVASNLVDNACKYTREAADKRVWLRAKPGRPGYWLLEVEDRGPGVTGRDRRSVFRPFRRGRGVDATAGGVGLGLALAKRWVTLLGGRLAVRTAPGGVGACFRVELPAKPECGGPH